MMSVTERHVTLGGKMLRNIMRMLGAGPAKELVTRGNYNKSPATRTLKGNEKQFQLAGVRVIAID